MIRTAADTACPRPTARPAVVAVTYRLEPGPMRVHILVNAGPGTLGALLALHRAWLEQGDLIEGRADG